MSTGEFLWKSLSLQQNFVSATSRTDSVWFDILRLVAATKFCCGVKVFYKNSPVHTKQFVVATCRLTVLLQLVAGPVHMKLHEHEVICRRDRPWELNVPLKGPAWQNIAGKKWHPWTQKKHLELFTSRRHFGEIKQPKTLNQPQGRATALASESKSCGSQKINMRVTTLLIKRPKFTFAQSKRFPPKHNLRGRENNSLEQAAFWHAIKVVCGLPIPLFYRGEITMTVGCSTELKELFAWTNIWWIGLLPNPVGRTQKTFFFPEQATPKVPSAPILKQISILGRANPGDQHPSFYSEIFRNLFITVLNIANDLLETLLDSLLTACIEIKPMGIVPVSLSVFTPVPNILTARAYLSTQKYGLFCSLTNV